VEPDAVVSLLVLLCQYLHLLHALLWCMFLPWHFSSLHSAQA